jgi:hypothetical protein
MDYLDFFYDGFDSPSAVAQLSGDWYLSSAGAFSLTTLAAFDGKQCLRWYNASTSWSTPNFSHTMDAAHDYLLAGVRAVYSLNGVSDMWMWQFMSGGTVRCGVRSTGGTGDVSFRTGSTLATELFAVADFVLTTEAYYEVEIYRHAVDGFVGLYRDGALIDSFSGDTSAIGGSMNRVALKGQQTAFGGTAHFRDFYCCGIENWTTEGGNNLGPGQSVVLVPDADDAVEFTPLGAGTNWSEVDELPNDADTSHNESDTPGHEDVFTHGGLTETGTIFAVAVEHTARRTADGLMRLYDVVQSGAVVDDGDLVTLGDTYINRLGEVHLKDPNGTAAWTSARVNALKFGYGNEV